jgi:hypothetical protein
MESCGNGLRVWTNLIARLRRTSHSSTSNAGKAKVGAIVGADTGPVRPRDVGGIFASEKDSQEVAGVVGMTTSDTAERDAILRPSRRNAARETRANVENMPFATAVAAIFSCC